MYIGFIVRLLILIVLVFTFSHSYSQTKLSDGETETKNKATQLFNDENYLEALPLFSNLLSNHPQDIDFNFAYAACLTEENKDLDKALQYLTFVMRNTEKPAALYYMGRIYHQKYKFDEALKYYNQFKEKAKKDDLRAFPVDRQIRMATSGKNLIRYVSELKVQDNKKVKSKDFYYSYQLADFGGKIYVKPEEFKSKVDKKKEKAFEDKPLMFISTELNVVYYSSYGDNDKNGKDIFRRTKDNATGEWSAPENLGAPINTEYDEDYPFISPDGATLYFSSKGHNSMGGYDIFKSTYDWTTNKWSDPVNMDFPTSSPYDDFLYITDGKEEVAYFASNRETGRQNVSVYRILVDKTPIKKEIDNIEEIVRKSRLEISVPLVSRVEKRDDDIKIKNNTQVDNKTKESNTSQGKYTFGELVFSDEMTNQDVYNEAENDAKALDVEAKNLQKESEILYFYSEKKNKEANEKRKEAETSKLAADKIKDEKTKEQETKIANDLMEEAARLARQAVLAFNLSNELRVQAEDKKKDAAESSNFSKELSFYKGKKTKDLVDQVNDHRKKLNNRQKVYTSVEKEIFRNKMSVNDYTRLLGDKSQEKDNLQIEIEDLKKKIKDNEAKIAKEINTATRTKWETQNQDWNIEVNNKQQKELQLTNEINRLNKEIKDASGDITFLQQMLDESRSSQTDFALIETENKKIDKSQLDNEISKKKFDVEKDQISFSSIVAQKEKDAADKEKQKELAERNKKLAKDKKMLESNQNYKRLIEEAKKSEQVSDSLTFIIDNKKKELAKINDAKKKDELQKDISSMQNVVDYKRTEADKKFTQADELGQSYIALNEIKPVDENKTTDNKNNNQMALVDNSNNSDTKTNDTKKDNANSTDNKEVKKDDKTTTYIEDSKKDTKSSIILQSVLSDKDQKKLANENPNYQKMLREGTKAKRTADSIYNLIEQEKNNLAKLKNAQEKQASQDKITNLESIAKFKKDLAEKRFNDVNTYEKSFLTSHPEIKPTNDGEKLLASQGNQSNDSKMANDNVKNNQNDTKTNQTNEVADNKTNADNKNDNNTNKDNNNKTDVTNKNNTEKVDSAQTNKVNQLAISTSRTVVWNSTLSETQIQELKNSNPAYLTKYTEANRAKTVADSLYAVADGMRAELKNIKDKKKKQNQEDKITNVENIAEFKKTEAERKFSGLNELEQEYIAAKNNVANKDDNKNKTDNKSTQLSATDNKTENDKAFLITNDGYKNLITDANLLQTKADSLNQVIKTKKENLPNIASKKDKKKEQELIAQLEDLALRTQQQADDKFQQANNLGTQLLANRDNSDTKNNQAQNNDNANKTNDNKNNQNTSDTKTNNDTKSELNNKTEKDKAFLVTNDGYRNLITDANLLQTKSDSLNQVIKTKKENLPNIASKKDKKKEQELIAQLEDLALRTQQQADEKFQQANTLGSELLANRDKSETNNNTVQNVDNANKTNDNKTTVDSVKNNTTTSEKIDYAYKNVVSGLKESNLSEKELAMLDASAEYKKQKSDALLLARESDSLISVAADKKTKLKDIKNKKEKVKEEKNITEIEKLASQKKDLALAKASETELTGRNLIAQKSENTDTKSNVSETVKIESYKSVLSDKEKQTLSEVPKYGTLVNESARSKFQSDSLYTLVENKKAAIKNITNPQEKQAEIDQINNLENIAKFKAENANRKLKEADDYGKNYLATNQTADVKTDNNKTDNKNLNANNKTNDTNNNNTENTTNNKIEKYTSVLSDKEQLALNSNTKYAKLVTDANKAQNQSDSLVAAADKRKANLKKIKNAQDKQTEQDQITNLENIAKVKSEIANRKRKEADEFGKNYLASNPTALNNTENPNKENQNKTDKVNQNNQGENKVNTDKNDTTGNAKNNQLADNKNDQANKVNTDKTNNKNNTTNDAKANNKGNDNKKDQNKNLKTDNKTNTEKDNKLADNNNKNDKLKTNNKTENTDKLNSKQANVNSQLEANKAVLMQDRKYSNLLSQAEIAETQADSLNYLVRQKKEQLAQTQDEGEKEKLNKEIEQLQNNANSKRQVAESKYTEASVVGENILAAQAKADKTNLAENNNKKNNDTEAKELKKKELESLLEASKAQMEDYKKKESDAGKYLTEVSDNINKVNAAKTDKEREKLFAELFEALDKSKVSLIESYKSKNEADRNKFTYMDIRSTEMLLLPEIQNNTVIAKRYKQDAIGFHQLAERAREKALNAATNDEKLMELKKANDYEQLAVKSNQVAIEILIDTKPVEFVSAENMLAPSDNDMFSNYVKMAINVNNAIPDTKVTVADYDKQAVRMDIVSKLYSISKTNKQVIDDAGKLKESIEKDVPEINALVEKYNESVGNAEKAANDKDKKKFTDKANEIQSKLLKKKSDILLKYQKEHEAIYTLYLRNTMAVKPTGNSVQLTEGMKTEAEATELYNKAKKLREQANAESDISKKVTAMEEASDLELKAIELQEKAYGIYMNLVTVKEEQNKKPALLLAQTYQKEKLPEVDVDKVLSEAAKNNTPVKDKVKKDNTNNQDQANKTNDTKNDNKGNGRKKGKQTIGDNKNNQTNNKNDKANKTDVKNNNDLAENKTEKNNLKNNQTDNKNNNDKNNKANNDNKVKDNKQGTDNTNNKTDNKTEQIEKIDNKQISALNVAPEKFGISINPRNTYSKTDVIPLNEELPAGIVFKVQIGAFKTPISPSIFKGLSPITCEQQANSQFVKYLAGMFQGEDAAKLAREEVRKLGYKDAFIVAYKDGVRIPLFKARKELKGASDDDARRYAEMSKSESENLSKNIKDAKANQTTNNQTVNDGGNDKKNVITENKKKNTDNLTATADNNKEADQNQKKVDAVNVKDVKGILYTVQIGVFKNAKTSKELNNLSPIFEEQIDLGGATATRYTTGIFADYIEAVSAKDRIVKLGIKDAYVIVYHNGKQVSVNQANLVVMQQGADVVANPKDYNITNASNADKLKVQENKPGKIVYKVQVGAFKEQVPNDIVDAFIKVAQKGGLSNFMDGDMKVYTVGEFKTYNEAVKMKQFVVEQGIKDAFVIGFDGTRKLQQNELNK